MTKVPEKEWFGDYEGQLTIDVFQDADSVTIMAPIAGVKPEDLEISITDEVVNIKGQRAAVNTVDAENYFAKECYWGAFSRSYILPMEVDSEKANASLKNGILSIVIPKIEKAKTKTIKIQASE